MSSLPTITLLEYERLYAGREDSKLPQGEFAALQQYLLNYPEGNDKEKPPLEVRGKYLRALNYVGAILTKEGRQIEILPKIDLAAGEANESAGSAASQAEQANAHQAIREIFMKMLLVYLGQQQRQYDRGAWGEASLPLLEIFFSIFLKDVATVVQRGLARSYTPYEDNLPCLKGKLDFSKQLRHNLLHKERFYVRFDEFSIDRPINRVIKQALRLVRRLAILPDNYRRAVQFLEHFTAVRDARSWQHEVQISSLDRSVSFRAYKEAFEWAKLLLQYLSPDNWSGERSTIALLFPMEKVFECYVAHRLEQLLSSTGVRLSLQDSGYKIMEEKLPPDSHKSPASFGLRPDLVMRGEVQNGSKFCTILDTKWKSLNAKNEGSPYGISYADIYQLYSYGKVYQQRDAYGASTTLALLYPQNQKQGFSSTIKFCEPSAKAQGAPELRDSAEPPAADEPLTLSIVPVNLAGLASDQLAARRAAEQQLLCDISKDGKEIYELSQRQRSGSQKWAS